MPLPKNPFSRFLFLHLSPKARRSLHRLGGAPLPTNPTVALTDSDWLRTSTPPALQSTFRPPIDTDANEDEDAEDNGSEVVSVRGEREENGDSSGDSSSVQENEGEGEDEPAVNDMIPGSLDGVQCLEDDVNTQGNDDGEENGEVKDEDDVMAGTPDTFQFEALVCRTRAEMMVQRLYLALTDDDAEIAALRTVHHERFTHVVRITFDTPSTGDTLAPSLWSSEVTFSSDAPFELRLNCPGFSRRSEHHTALTKRQLLHARRYITISLPYRSDKWVEQGLKFPLTPEECERTRLLVVGPPDRSVDVMAVFVCYLKFLGGVSAPTLLNSVRKLNFVHQHWKDCSTGRMAQAMTTLLSSPNLA